MDKVFEDYVIDITHPDVPRQPKATLPMAFRPSSTFKRSIAQSGVFTIAGKSRDPLNRLSLPEFSVERLVVPERHKKRVLLDLLDLNISKGSLFGDYDSIAQSIRYRYSKEYLNAVS